MSQRLELSSISQPVVMAGAPDGTKTDGEWSPISIRPAKLPMVIAGNMFLLVQRVPSQRCVCACVHDGMNGHGGFKRGGEILGALSACGDGDSLVRA